MRASEVMIADPVVVAAGATSSEVATIVVLDSDKRVLGFILHPEKVQGIVIVP